MQQDNSYLFATLYDEWFDNKKYWFSKNPEYDRYLADKYFVKVESFDNELSTQPISVQIGAIIAFDQIARHYQRVYVTTSIDLYCYSKLASEISLSLMEYLSTDLETYKRITAHNWCFILLPFRHIRDTNKINTIIKFLIEKHNKPETSQDDKAIYKSFLKQTLNDVYSLNTEAAISEQKDTHRISMNTTDQWNKYSNVLQHIPSDPIIRSIEDSKAVYLIKQFKQNTRHTQIDDKTIIVSLSGGVDSSVCLFLCRYIYPMHTIVAIHINYNNRPECNDELRFVRKYCAILNVKLFHRTITEMMRADCHHQGLRDIYESVTRDIRFDMYKQISKMYSPSLIILGHNADDCCENIITNICSKTHYNNLCGMTIYEKFILRPLLTVKKSEIIVFAIQMNIPFLKNSTPAWSARGKIRDSLLPALSSVHPDAGNSLIALNDYLQTTDAIIDSYVKSNVLPKFKKLDTDIFAIFKLGELETSYNIWIKIFAHFNIAVSHKALTEYIAFLQRLRVTNKKIKFILRPDVMVMAFVKNDKVKLVICENAKN